MKNKIRFTFVGLLLGIFAFSQNKVTDIGLEVQVYPTGIIPGIRAEKSLNKHGVGSVRLGYQIIDHKDAGVHDDEKGTGFGLTVGYKYYFQKYFTGLHLALRTDAWYNTIEWEDYLDTGKLKGTTNILVLQPTVELGWTFSFSDNLLLVPAIAAGFEKTFTPKVNQRAKE
ncbi:MAG: hypothetical protein IPN76_15650 [Saprospiraceae bacterium]|nr:hypothetical protein [Saprospiraceae bacterium]